MIFIEKQDYLSFLHGLGRICGNHGRCFCAWGVDAKSFSSAGGDYGSQSLDWDETAAWEFQSGLEPEGG
jgi:hypothetical protein